MSNKLAMVNIVKTQTQTKVYLAHLTTAS